MKTLTNQFWGYVESKKEKSKLCKKVFNWLDRDNLQDIIIDEGSVYWVELTCPSRNRLPDYVGDFIKCWCKTQGYEYLYDKYPF